MANTLNLFTSRNLHNSLSDNSRNSKNQLEHTDAILVGNRATVVTWRPG